MANPNPILDRLDDGTLVRNVWTGTDAQGRATACLLAALVPACGYTRSATACPADVMPAWLARLTPWIDDAGTAAAWPGHIREYARLVPHFGRLSAEPDTDRRAMIGSLRAIAEAATHADGAVSAVLALLDRELAGDRPTAAEYRTAADAATANAADAYAAYAAYAGAAANANGAANAADGYANANAADGYADAAANAASADRVITGILAAIADAMGVGRG